ncbi:GNAT family N-acetyltransferase [Paenibacillus tianjinensis]|uniref:GNAT family N-acetyltransferase n=1 Tax=Paenibacillus tianjinensis TaxID=2810347 RepID=A0ABX7LGQ7_9BACL|nr:GNAT family N-acetyltransferase [Paenibacillus tianjinensis]QSF46018.1 GNAT family N-acetyltransferase [Paenibacillus tianjinensis]
MFTILLADLQDAVRLAEVQKRTFDADARQFQNKEEDGPPGYDSAEWQAEQMNNRHYYKLLADNNLIGGMIVFPSPGAEECHLGRIFIDPLHQNRGYGQECFRFLFQTYPSAKKWTLDTPSWAARNHYFYQKLGFVRTGETLDRVNGEAIIEYERASKQSE